MDGGDAQNSQKDDLGFAPHNPTDGRGIGDWKSRYHGSGAILHIRLELSFLLFLFFVCPLTIFLVWVGWLQGELSISDNKYSYLMQYIYASVGGLLGGTLFSLKWLYHSVAKGTWNLDRRLWRFITPLLSAGLAFVSVVFVKSGLFSAFDAKALSSGTMSFSAGFIVGYFSDSFMAKLAEIAQTLFGSSSKH
jgi:hypothetical protein